MASSTATDAPSTLEYISHHLHHLQTSEQHGIVNFSIVNLDTLFFSLLALATVLTALRFAARRATSDVPGRFQVFVEMLVELVEEQSKSIIAHGNRAFIAPLALTVFCWVFAMNALDLLPVDWIPSFSHHVLGLEHTRPVPTADLNGPMGMSLGVLILMLFYAVKIKGLGGWTHELYTAPFGTVKLSGNPLTWVGFLLMSAANLGLNLIEYAAKFVSLGMRLFGNMYAGELLFFLIAAMGGAWAWHTDLTVLLALGQVFAGTAWLLFHILIILIQAFIFMMLTMVYIGQSHDAH